ncbi:MULTISPECIES: NAD(P)-binding domain-containing protein [unclassified Rhodococcus (in: high G+C Gram-positive bacteria)]|uniref:RraA family protein n=1 Tax=unclassified Rhodococcus (in: high G+C Gram-positive bacteria) TaxID=192944 RepID=UPI00163A2249|nr:MULTISPECIES: NAD(P)-binding domain-containing protein [unclassified Rhodococcus (in: high G+C Gram-positive bacteria)]MBC2640486.1 transferase [Rhodococcus sp. 3A]MBC2894768.1 transferase [Rhodococcus sp. 4CII]
MKVAVLGLGEAGSLYSSGFLAKGWEVTGFDPADTATPAGVLRFDDVADAVRGAELVLSLTSAKVALRAATDAAPHLAEGACYADMNAASAEVKNEVATVVERVGAVFADVAVVGSVPAHGVRTNLVISGSGSAVATGFFESLGASVEDIGGAPGDASNRKLLRSTFMKGLGALIVESVDAGKAADAEQWVRQQIANELAGSFSSLDRLRDGTRKHAGRRSVEAAASVELLDNLGVRPVLASATARVHAALADANGRDIVELFEAYAGLPVANIGDARQRMGMVDSGIHAMWKGARIVGRARTVWTRAGDNKALHEALAKVQPGEVIVINGQGDQNRALMGELIAERARSRGCVGMVIDGAARDIDVLQEIGFGVWARAVNPSGPYKDGPGKIDVPVAVGGVVCAPGDLVVADDDGVIIVPAAEAFTSLAGGRAVEADEAQRRAAIIAARKVAS